MLNTDYKSWFEKLEVTSPIKSIMGFVNDLAANYEMRLAAIKAEYKKDIEDFISCYRTEKQYLHKVIHEQSIKINQLEAQIKGMEQTYKISSVEHKIAKDSLQDKFNEIAMLSEALKSEQELIQIAEHTIQAANMLITTSGEQPN